MKTVTLTKKVFLLQNQNPSPPHLDPGPGSQGQIDPCDPAFLLQLNFDPRAQQRKTREDKQNRFSPELGEEDECSNKKVLIVEGKTEHKELKKTQTP